MSAPLTHAVDDSLSRRLAQGAGLALLGSALIAVAAHVAVPFWPVPLTLQTLAVLGLGALLGPTVGCAAVLAYGLEGLAGLPVFAHGSGLATLLGPTGGYVLGFLPAVMMSGLAGRRGWLHHSLKAALAFLLADIAIFACGVAWLATLVGWDKAISGGLVPFLTAEALKLALLVVSARALRRSTRRA